MTLVERIDSISRSMPTMPLSTLLVQILPIALELDDFEGYSILSCWNNPVCKDQAANKLFLEQVAKVIQTEGTDRQNAFKIVTNAYEKYLLLRTVDEDKVLMFSAKELEDKIEELNEMLQSMTVPQGLHPADAYYHSLSVDKSRARIIENRDMIQRQYAVLQSYIVAKLAEYRRKESMNIENATQTSLITPDSGQKEPIIFLSHRSSDKKYGDALEKLIVGLGVKNHQLIYSSHPLHKIPLDKNIYDYLRENIGRDTFVIILWSDAYLDSPACLNEMGAAWVMQTDYTNIYTPDFSFGNPKYHQCAVDTRMMGAVLNGDQHCKASMIELKNKIVKMFGLQVDEQSWTYLLDEFINDIKTDSPKAPRVENGVLIFD